MSINLIGTALNSGNSAAASVTHGQTIKANDVVLILVHRNTAGGSIADNNGSTPMTEVFEEDHPSGDTSRYCIFSRIAGSSEPATYSFTNTSSNWTCNFRLYRGVHTASISAIWDVTPSASTRGSGTTGTTATAPTMVTTYNGSMGLVWVGTDSGVTFSGQTDSYTDEAENGAAQCNQASYNRLWSTPGDTTSVAVTLSGSNDWWAHQFALRANVPLQDWLNTTTVLHKPRYEVVAYE